MAESTDSPLTTNWIEGLAFVKKAKLISYKPASAIRILKWSWSHLKLSGSKKLKGKVNKLAADIKGIETRLPSVFALSPEKQSELFIQGQMFDLESKMHKRLQDWVLEKIHSQVEVIEMSNDQKIAIAKESVQNTVKALISDTVRKALEDAPTDFMNKEEILCIQILLSGKCRQHEFMFKFK